MKVVEWEPCNGHFLKTADKRRWKGLVLFLFKSTNIVTGIKYEAYNGFKDIATFLFAILGLYISM